MFLKQKTIGIVQKYNFNMASPVVPKMSAFCSFCQNPSAKKLTNEILNDVEKENVFGKDRVEVTHVWLLYVTRRFLD